MAAISSTSPLQNHLHFLSLRFDISFSVNKERHNYAYSALLQYSQDSYSLLRWGHASTLWPPEWGEYPASPCYKALPQATVYVSAGWGDVLFQCLYRTVWLPGRGRRENIITQGLLSSLLPAMVPGDELDQRESVWRGGWWRSAR